MDDQQLLDGIRNQASTFVPNPRRAAILLALLPGVGLEPTSPGYAPFMYPNDDPAVGKQLGLHQSGCGIYTEVGWRASPVREPALHLPIAQRSAQGGRLYPVALERDVAAKWDAWTDCSVWTPGKASILPADTFIIGCSSCPGVWAKGGIRVEHEFTAAFLDPETGELWSLDGGQPGIHVRKRKLIEVPDKKELWVGNIDASGVCQIDPADGRPVRGRRVLGIIDADNLPLELA